MGKQNSDVSRQPARKGWVNEQINDMANRLFNHFIHQLNGAAAELTVELDIFKEILVTKMGVTPEQIIEADKIIMDRMQKDNEIIKKHKNDTTKTVEQRLEAMKTDGISERAFVKISALLKDHQQQTQPETAPSPEIQATEIQKS